MAISQEHRFISIDTPLGKDVLILASFTGTEGISSLFRFELDLFSENHDIKFDKIIGKKTVISMSLADGGTRYFNGVISRFSQGRGGGEQAGSDPRYSRYSATMVPWPWLLSRTTDSRIFQQLSVPEIVEQIFTEKEFADYRFQLSSTYEKREYCVQYNESDFNFVSRLLEDEGIFYFFEHESDKHTLVLADAPEENKPCPNQASARYQTSAGGWLERDVITGLERSQEIQAGKYTLTDYNFKIPATDLKVEAPSNLQLGPGEREFYDYPGTYGKRNQGDRLVNIRMQEEEAGVTVIHGSSDCRAFTSGYRFDLTDHYRSDMDNKPFVITAVDHQVTPTGEFPGSARATGTAPSYSNRFHCIPFDTPFRPRRATPIPLISGTQTAIVVGPAGEEIYTDEHGRVKVQFHWDREGNRDENSSCWMRVSQSWAGAGWGGVYIPRIGHEVIVDFLEGNPDRPIITGRVYHGRNTPPYALPGNKTQSGVKTRSSAGGGGDNYNEIMFEDKTGQEKLSIHAEKDQSTSVEADQSISVGHDRSKTVGHDEKNTIEQDRTTDINQGDDKLTVKTGDRKLSVKTGDRVVVVATGDDKFSVKGNQVTVIEGNYVAQVKSAQSLTVKDNSQLIVQSGRRLVQVPANNYDLSAKKVQIIAAEEIKIQSGASSITIKPDSIELSAPKITSQAVGIHEVKGALIKIN